MRATNAPFSHLVRSLAIETGFLGAALVAVNVLGTEVYLKATPQLLHLASQRFEQHARRKRGLR